MDQNQFQRMGLKKEVAPVKIKKILGQQRDSRGERTCVKKKKKNWGYQKESGALVDWGELEGGGGDFNISLEKGVSRFKMEWVGTGPWMYWFKRGSLV